MQRRHVVVAVSGGVDSSVALCLAAREARKITAVHLRLFDRTAPTDDIRALCQSLGADFQILDLRQTFDREVIAPFVREYARGRTPNPCIWCNPRIKLGALMEWALAHDADAVATGHYARVKRDPASGFPRLLRGADRTKDQSYYLCRLPREALARFETPLGAMTKDHVRTLAREMNLPAAERTESQEICFIPDNDYRRFVAERLPADADTPGPIVDLETGRRIGVHRGIHDFTIGQRRGIGIAAPHPLYVVDIRAEEATVVVGCDSDLLARSMLVSGATWGSLPRDAPPVRARVQVRYRASAQPATLIPESNALRVEFDAPQRAITPGQTAAFYDEADQLCLGGATIDTVTP